MLKTCIYLGSTSITKSMTGPKDIPVKKVNPVRMANLFISVSFE
jgi:hypothetical protein